MSRMRLMSSVLRLRVLLLGSELEICILLTGTRVLGYTIMYTVNGWTGTSNRPGHGWGLALPAPLEHCLASVSQDALPL